MGFLDKAKSAIHDLSKQIDSASDLAKKSGLSPSETKTLASISKDIHVVDQKLNKMGINEPASTTTSSSTSTSYAATTPSSASTYSATPPSSIATRPLAMKLPLAIRKEVRDDWEAKVPSFEVQLTDLLGTPWTIDIDPSVIYPYALQTGSMSTAAKTQPGRLLSAYLENLIRNIGLFLAKMGQHGKDELNNVASAHVVTMGESEDPKVTVCGCDISNGTLRILFGKEHFGFNVGQATGVETLQAALQKGGISSAQGGLDFDTRSGIKKDFDPKIAALTARIKSMLGLDSLVLNPCFEANHAKLSASTNPSFQKNMGSWTLMYFDALARNLDLQGFKTDAMLQEALVEALGKKEIRLEVVDQLQRKSYNEAAFEEDVLYVRTTPQYFGTNIAHAGVGIIDLL